MTNLKLWLTTIHVIASLLAMAVECCASSRDRVAVAEAVVYAAQNARPALNPDTFKSVPPRIEPIPETAAEIERLRLESELDDLRHAAIERQETITAQAHEIAQLRIAGAHKPEIPTLIESSPLPPDVPRAVPSPGTDGKPSSGGSFRNGDWHDVGDTRDRTEAVLEPMRLVPLAGATQSTGLSCITYMTRGCIPCHQMQKQNGNGNDQLSCSYSDGSPGFNPESYPCTVFTDGNGKKRVIYGKRSVDQLIDIISRNDPPANAMQATGAAGAIHAGPQIRQALDYFRQYVGEGKTASFTWDRTAATLNLFATKTWDAKGLFGTSGRIQIDAPNAINLPLKEIAFGYRMIGRDVKLDLEPILLSGMVDRLEPNHVQSYGSNGQPVGIIGIDDALLVYNVFAMVREIFTLLHPSADVVIGEQVAASAVLSGDTLTVNFDKPVTVCLKWLFTFNLAVKKVTISEQNIHVDFSGSRWIKSRDFSVGGSSATPVGDQPPFVAPAVPIEQIKPIEQKPVSAIAPHVGQHSHRCRHCNIVWWHGGESANSWDAHRCKRCGREVTEIESFL